MLKIGGAGLATAGFASPSAADRPDQVFVYPTASADTDDVVDAVTRGGGRVRFRYEHFPYVAATVPEQHRGELRNDRRVRQVVEDYDVFLHGHKEGHATKEKDPVEPRCEEHPPQNPSWGYDRIGAGEAHQHATGDGVDVAIIDSGIQEDHCDLAGGVVAGPRCVTKGSLDDEQGHGTMCAGIVGARTNDIGVVGVAPEARMHAVKVFASQGATKLSYILCGIDWCLDNEIEIISMSLGSKAPKDPSKDPFAPAAAIAYERGHLLVASAGNDGNDRDGECKKANVGTPAALPEVIAVSAMEQPGRTDYDLAYFSSVGPEVELMAPGVYVRTTTIRNQYDDFHGTSASCPHVAGAAALAWEQVESDGPDTLDRDRIRTALQDTAESMGLADCEEGYGLVRADRLAADLA